jgi:ketosteroid isomerase-like protein
MAAAPSMLLNERSMQRFAFYIDSEQNKACNLHVAQRPLTKGVLFAPGNMDVTGDVRNPHIRGRSAMTNLDSPQMKTEQTSTSDPQLRQQFGAKNKRFDEACNNNDAVAITAFFTEDAVLVTETGSVCGRKAIEKSFADLFQKWRVSHHIRKRDQYSPHITRTAGNEMWATGVWSATLQGQSGGPIQHVGHWTVIRGVDDWKIQMLALERNPGTGCTLTDEIAQKSGVVAAAG